MLLLLGLFAAESANADCLAALRCFAGVLVVVFFAAVLLRLLTCSAACAIRGASRSAAPTQRCGNACNVDLHTFQALGQGRASHGQRMRELRTRQHRQHGLGARHGFGVPRVEDCTASYFAAFKQATIEMVVAQDGTVGWIGMLGAVRAIASG